MQGRLCTGPLRRREFMRIGTMAPGGLTSPQLLARRAQAGSPVEPDTSVILFWMWGGPSQFETWNMKPDAPAEIRGPLKPIPTVVPGMDLCEYIETRDRYGRHRWGQSCLLARRLAEAGSAVINIDATAPNDTTKNFSWDDHAGAFHLDYAQRERLPQMDEDLCALIDDIYERGLDRKVLLIACGEFGRTPNVTHAPKNFSDQIGLGRDHWPYAFSALISGGGLRMGQVVGETNARGEHPVRDRVTPQDLLATVYSHLGIDFTQPVKDLSGRPIPILPHGSPIAQLL